MDWLTVSSAVVGTFGGLVGAVGGVVSVLVYKDQRRDQRRREDIAHIPVEIQPLLVEMLEFGLRLETEDHPSGVAMEARTLEKDWRPLSHQATSALRGDGPDFARISICLQKLCTGHDADGLRWGDGEVQTNAERHNTARELTDSATDLLNRIRTGVRMPERPADGSDVPPISRTRRLGRLGRLRR